MAGRNRQLVCLLFFLSLFSLSLAASPTLFCKCTCFTNSTIIPLTQQSPNSDATTPTTRSCNDCTKRFCLDYNLPICASATEDDVLTKCFQRDSTKDEAIVLIFIFATLGLLAWAAVKPWVVKWRAGNGRARASYLPVPGPG
ncbi:hypothetical protein BDY17DRAFT_21222 [Neohortaea acidophila]|uniref:Uncharacterized protein n=1 Tax=Neohortaea acidophila TaxID=245834 RepID=A0A6A6Q6J8_9PEZI|nr:uncharacterized protein BDY17DRAFT_21222 [Neohortaea acidophila]KAF2487935.1 hypothetical protein BDY17DRAFT_21222 [Neohortaea acidophila]